LASNPLLSTYRVEELDRNLFLLAELYLFRFEKPDSAFNQYDYLVREFPVSPYTPRALYNMAHLYETHYNNPEQVRLTYQALAEEYGSSPYANAARIRLGVPVVPTRNDTISTLFRQAEAALFDENLPVKALGFYDEIWTRFHDTDDAARAYYAKGYVYETCLDSLERARTVYDSLMSWFPESPYALKVKPKLETVLEKLTSIDKIAGKDSVQAADSSGHGSVAMTDSAGSSEDVILASADEESEQGDSLEPGRRPDLSDENAGSGARRMPFRLDVMARIRQQQRLLQTGHREAEHRPD
jgi:tetratricopeptide (TPR) repeat protein